MVLVYELAISVCGTADTHAILCSCQCMEFVTECVITSS